MLKLVKFKEEPKNGTETSY